MKARAIPKLKPDRGLAENSARTVAVRLTELRSFAPGALAPEASRDQHDMRIAAKRLRYVLEATGFTLGEEGQAGLVGAKTLQGLLGDIHDCDVLLPRVEQHIEGLKAEDAISLRAAANGALDLEPKLASLAPHRTAYQGLETLEVYLRARRILLHDRFSELWTEQGETGLWDRLEQAAARSLGEARERRKAAKG